MKEKVQREKEVARDHEKSFHQVLLSIVILISMPAETLTMTMLVVEMMMMKLDIHLRPRDLVSSRMLKLPSEPLLLNASLVLLSPLILSPLSSKLLRALDLRTKVRASINNAKINVLRDKTRINTVNNLLRTLINNNNHNNTTKDNLNLKDKFKDSTDLKPILNIVLNNNNNSKDNSNRESTSCRVKCTKPIINLNNHNNSLFNLNNHNHNLSSNLQFPLRLQCLISTTSLLANKQLILNINPQFNKASSRVMDNTKHKVKHKVKDKNKTPR